MDKEIKVLLVDDEADFIQAMEFWLKSKGYAVMTALDGRTAIEIAKENKPDIIFLDLTMPVMDGVEVLRAIRKIEREVPVIIISAYVEDRQRIEKVESLGISGVFYKGANFEEGLRLLESTLRTHKKLKKENQP